MIIGIAGKAGVGKDTVTSYIETSYNYSAYAFATPIKALCSAMFGVPLNYFNDTKLKATVIEKWGLSPRQMMQKFGEDAIKPVFGEDIWVKYLTINHPDLIKGNIIFSDVRCQSEIDLIRKNNGSIIHITSPNMKNIKESNHKTEQPIQYDILNDYSILNDGTLEELYMNIDNIFSLL